MDSREGYTVRQAIEDYLAEYKRQGRSVADMTYRINAFILPELGNIEVAKLKSKRLREWRNKLADAPARLRTRPGNPQKYREDDDDETKRRRRHTANKVLTILKAALNFAFTEGVVADDTQWRRVKPFMDVDKAKIRFPSGNAEIVRLVNACEGAFKSLVQGALLSGCRYGELTKARVADFDAGGGTLRVKTGKKNGKEAIRSIALTEEGAAS